MDDSRGTEGAEVADRVADVVAHGRQLGKGETARSFVVAQLERGSSVGIVVGDKLLKLDPSGKLDRVAEALATLDRGAALARDAIAELGEQLAEERAAHEETRARLARLAEPKGTGKLLVIDDAGNRRAARAVGRRPVSTPVREIPGDVSEPKGKA